MQSEKSYEIIKNNEIFSEMLNSCNEWIIYSNAKNVITKVSNSAQSLFGVKTATIIGLSINELFNLYNPEITLMINNFLMNRSQDHLSIDNITFNFVAKKTKESKKENKGETGRFLNDMSTSRSRVTQEDKHGRMKINLSWSKMKKTIYSIGFIFIIQPLISK